MKTTAFFISALILSSCSIYNENFDCPAGKGVGCKSVGEVLDMIVERESCEDLFIRDIGCALALREEEETEKKYSKISKKKRGPLKLIQTETGELALEKEENGEKGNK